MIEHTLNFDSSHSSVAFMPKGTGSTGFSLAYPKITLHAVSRNADAGNCLYCQIADPSVEPVANESDEDEEDDEEYEPLREMRIYVKDDAARELGTAACRLWIRIADSLRVDHSRPDLQCLHGLCQPASHPE